MFKSRPLLFYAQKMFCPNYIVNRLIVEVMLPILFQVKHLPWDTILLALACLIFVALALASAIEPMVRPATKAGYMNKSPLGYYYETETMSFSSAADRSIAVQWLLKTLATSGVIYTPEQISTVRDELILSMVESEDNDFNRMAAKLVILVDPMYKAALAIVNSASGANSKIASDGSRQIVYDLLVKYFLSKKTPIGIPIGDWSDFLLIRTFRSLRLPDKTDFSKYPNVAPPDATAAVPPGVDTVTPAVPPGVATVTPAVPVAVAS